MKKRFLITLIGILLVACIATGCIKKDTQAENRIAELAAENARLKAENTALQAELDKAENSAATETAVASQPLEKSETSFPVIGRWRITGSDKNRVFTYRAYMTIENVNNTEFSASIDWHDRAGSVAKENVRGTYNPQNRQITLTRGFGVEITTNVFKGLFDDIDGQTFVAYLSADGLDFTEGKWMNGGEWEAHPPENGVDFPDEYYSEEEQFRPQWAWDDY